jgi:hypothetical protein
VAQVHHTSWPRGGLVARRPRSAVVSSRWLPHTEHRRRFSVTDRSAALRKALEKLDGPTSPAPSCPAGVATQNKLCAYLSAIANISSDLLRHLVRGSNSVAFGGGADIPCGCSKCPY